MRAPVDILKPSPAAYVVDEDITEICSTLVNIANQTLKTLSVADAESATTIIYIGSDKQQVTLGCI
jgi:hypothetical protein